MADLDWRHWVLSHLVWVVAVTILVIGGYQYMQSREALAKAEQVEKDSQVVIDSLKQQITERDQANADLKAQMVNRDAQTAAQINALTKAVAQVKTPEQVIASLPVVTDLPLNAHTIPNSPQISVDAVPLFQGLAVCKADKTTLEACQANFADEKKIVDNQTKSLADKDAIIDQKQKDIDGYKKAAGHHGFFGKVWDGAKKVGLLGIGIALGKAL